MKKKEKENYSQLLLHVKDKLQSKQMAESKRYSQIFGE